MTNYNELIGRHLVKVNLRKGVRPEIILSVDGIIEEVDATTVQSGVFFRINGLWEVFSCKADVQKAITKKGREYLFDTGYTYFKIF